MRPPLWIFALSGLTDFQKLVAVVLWTHANPDNIEDGCAIVWPRVKTVVGELGRDSRGRERSTSAVHRAVRALAAHGVLERKSVSVGGREIPGFALQVDQPATPRDPSVTPCDQAATDSDRPDTVTDRSYQGCPPVTTTIPAGHPDSTDRLLHKNDNRTTTERQQNDKTSTTPAPLTLIPDEQVETALSAYDRLAGALHRARQRAWEGQPKRLQHRALTSTRRKLVDDLLREGYTVDDLERALLRKGEDAFRRPTYTQRNGKTASNRELVSIEHLARRDRSDRALRNLERMLGAEGLDDAARSPDVPLDSRGRHMSTGGELPANYHASFGMTYGPEAAR